MHPDQFTMKKKIFKKNEVHVYQITFTLLNFNP